MHSSWRYGIAQFIPIRAYADRIPASKHYSQKKIHGWNAENTKNFLVKLKTILRLNSAEKWNSLTQKQIKLHGGGSLLNKYSMYEIKCMGNPEGEKLYTKSILKNYHGYWDKQENVQSFLNKLKKNLNLQTPENWNLLTQNQIQKNGGNRLLSKYSMYEIKCLGCPEGKHLFDLPIKYKSKGFWDNQDNIQNFLLNLGSKLNFKTPENWNLLTIKQIQEHGGITLLNKHSLFEIKCIACPEGKRIFANTKKPSGYWNDLNNVQLFLSQLKVKLNLNTPEDWNLLNQNQVKSNGGSTLLDKYSMYELKCLGCPDGKIYLNYPSKPNGYWDDKTNIETYLGNLKKEFRLNSPKDWERISKNQIYAHGGQGLCKYSKNQIINYVNDTNSSDDIILSNSKLSGKSSQRWLFLQIQKLFPNEEIVEDYYHSELSRETGTAVQFDIFLLQKNIAIEYHGKHHYEDIPSGFAPLEMYQNRDKEKQNICSQFGIKLLIIPYWWDNKLDSLKKIVSKVT